jgi:hypothetical protein
MTNQIKLNQIIAIEKGVKNQTTRVETDLYHSLEKKQLFAGLSRTYRPKDEEDGDRLPPESVSVQIKSTDVLKQLTQVLTRLFDVTATKDAANTRAKADVVVDGTVIAAAVPVTTLMFFEKELEKIAAFVGRVPLLDPAIQWSYDDSVGVFRSAPVETVRTKKVPKNHVLAEATKEHPAQVQMFTEDIPVGMWSKTEFSGAMKADDVAAIASRVDKLRTAVKFAREEANSIAVEDVHYGENILNYLFEGGSQVSG